MSAVTTASTLFDLTLPLWNLPIVGARRRMKNASYERSTSEWKEGSACQSLRLYMSGSDRLASFLLRGLGQKILRTTRPQDTEQPPSRRFSFYDTSTTIFEVWHCRTSPIALTSTIQIWLSGPGQLAGPRSTLSSKWTAAGAPQERSIRKWLGVRLSAYIDLVNVTSVNGLGLMICSVSSTTFYVHLLPLARRSRPTISIYRGGWSILLPVIRTGEVRQVGSKTDITILVACRFVGGSDVFNTSKGVFRRPRLKPSGDSDVSWPLYRDRSEWNDIKPVPEDDGPSPVVVIAHSERFEDVYDYFRAILQLNEKSERALNLTTDAITLNPANYTVWQYRRDLLKALNSDLRSELSYVEAIINQSPKNYQVWHHRRVLVEWLKDPSLELELTGNALLEDPKNYHAWQHRQWVIKTFGLYDKEMEFVDNLISEDVRNNSAWNQRYFVVNSSLGWSDLNVQTEICYTLEKIKFVKNNESAWNYLRGVLLHDKRGLSGNAVVTSFCEDLYKTKCRSPYLLAFIIDICDDAIKKGETNYLYNADRAVKLCQALAEKFDKIRSKYWTYICEKFFDLKENEEDNQNIDGSDD
ncbi:hypothetical protein EVAR_101147_1 [Eumeta japonica]|uniref:Protein farnesyltransferase/geranylgeranyltransferase type-1 subunit alpha n=1 Tax=Eumeta variegata TaxID=151549 RepID=A0A4C2A8I9_EUMVA|nr:hypothetical protein EVAR_101147_1 [Eumeta japonica]